jgi:hypothetical protein
MQGPGTPNIESEDKLATLTIPEVLGLFMERVEELEWYREETSREEVDSLSREITAAIQERPDATDGLMALLRRLHILTKPQDAEVSRRPPIFLARLAQYKKLIAVYDTFPLAELAPASLEGVIDALRSMSPEDAEGEFERAMLVKSARELLTKVQESRGAVLPMDVFGSPASTNPAWVPSFVPTSEDAFGLPVAWKSAFVPEAGALQPAPIPWVDFRQGTPCILLYPGDANAIRACEEARANGVQVCDISTPETTEGDCVSFGPQAVSPGEIAESVARSIDSAMAREAAGVPAEEMVHNPTRAPGKAYSVLDQKLYDTDETYAAIFDAYPYPGGADWPRLTQYYLDLENRLDEGDSWDRELSSGAIELIWDLQGRALGELNAGLVPYEISQGAEDEVRDIVRHVYGIIAAAGSAPTTNEERVALGDALYRCISGLGCEALPGPARAAVSGSVWGHGAFAGIVKKRLGEVESYWDTQRRRYIPGGAAAVEAQLTSLLSAAVRDESLKPTTLVDYSLYLPETLSREEAELLVIAVRRTANAKVDDFADHGVMPGGLGALLPTETAHTDAVAIGMDAVRAKYGMQKFDLFGTQGLVPSAMHWAIIASNAAGVRAGATRAIDDLAAFVDTATGLTPEEFQRQVSDKIAAIDRDVNEGLLTVARSCISSQEVWDSFFAFCNEVQAINQIVYLGMFKGIQKAAAGIVATAFAGSRAAGQAETIRWHAKSTALIKNDIRYANFDSFCSHYLIQQATASSITSRMNGVGKFEGLGYNGMAFPKGMAQALRDAEGNIIGGSWADDVKGWFQQQRNPSTGELFAAMSPTELRAWLTTVYKEMRKEAGLNPEQLRPTSRLGLFVETEEEQRIRQALNVEVTEASQPSAAATVTGPGGLPALMMSFGPLGLAVGVGAAATETIVDGLLARVQPKLATMSMAPYAEGLQALFAGLESRLNAGESIDLTAEMEAFFDAQSAPLAGELLNAEISMMTETDWEEMGANQDQPGEEEASIGYEAGRLVAEIGAIAGNPSAYPEPGARMAILLGALKSLEAAQQMTPALLAQIEYWYTKLEQEVVRPFLLLEQGKLEG